MRERITITCTCCGQRGPIHGRNLIISCYNRHRRAGTLAQFPRLTEDAETWIPTRPHARRLLAHYQELAATRPPLTKARIAWELGVTERQVERYAAAARTQQTTDTRPRTEAA